MAKEAYYFSHDFGARNDPKLQKVLMKLGHVGKSVYWDLVEMLYEEGGYLNLNECENYAFALRTDCDCIMKLIKDFDLFKYDKNKFWSDSILRRLVKRNEKSEKAALSAKKRWEKPNASNNNANALQNGNVSNAKNKIKEIKKEEIKANPLEEDIFSSNKDLKIALDAFMKMRIKIKKPLTDHALDLIKKDVWKFAAKNINTAIEILNYSTKGSYQGIFEPKNNNNKQHENKSTIPAEQKQFKL